MAAAVKAMALVITLEAMVTTNGVVMKNAPFGCHQIQDNNRLAAIVNNSILSSRNVNYGSCCFIVQPEIVRFSSASLSPQGGVFHLVSYKKSIDKSLKNGDIIYVWILMQYWII